MAGTFSPHVSKAPGITNDQVSKGMQLAPQKLQRGATYTYFEPKSSPTSNALAGGASVTTGTNVLAFANEGVQLESYLIGTCTKFVPDMVDTDGLNIVLGEASTEGTEYGFGVTTASRHAKTIGTSEAFFIEAEFDIDDVSDNLTTVIGFRKAAAYSDTALLSDPYTDVACIGITASAATADVKIYTRLNSGTAVNTDTTQNWADGETHSLSVVVQKGGRVSFFFDGAQVLATNNFTFDNTDVVVPFIRYISNVTSPDPTYLNSLEVGPTRFA